MKFKFTELFNQKDEVIESLKDVLNPSIVDQLKNKMSRSLFIKAIDKYLPFLEFEDKYDCYSKHKLAEHFHAYNEDGQNIINIDGELLFEQDFDQIHYYSKENKFFCKKDNLYGLYDYDGKKLINPEYKSIKFMGMDYVYVINNDNKYIIHNIKTGAFKESTYLFEKYIFQGTLGYKNYSTFMEHSIFRVAVFNGEDFIFNFKYNNIYHTPYGFVCKEDNVVSLYDLDFKHKLLDKVDEIYYNSDHNVLLYRKTSDSKINFFTLNNTTYEVENVNIRENDITVMINGYEILLSRTDVYNIINKI